MNIDIKPEVSYSAGNLRIRVTDSDAGLGFTIGYRNGDELHVCGLNTSPEYNIPVRGIFMEDGIPPFDHEYDWFQSDPDEPWIFSFLTGSGAGKIMDVLSVPDDEREEYSELIGKVLGQAREYLVNVDTRASDALAKSSEKSLDFLSFYSGDSDRHVRRRQAAESYPLAAGLMAKEVSLKIAIDRSQSLAPVLKTALENRSGATLSKGVLKRLARAPELPDGCSLATVARFCSLVPPDWIPNEGDQWTAFCHSAEALLTELEATNEDVPDLIKGRGGDWTRFLAKASKEGGRETGSLKESIEFTRSRMAEAHTMAREFADIFLLPAAAGQITSTSLTVTPEMRSAAIQSAYAILFRGRSAIEISDLTRRWSLNRAKIDEAIYGAAEIEAKRLVSDIEEDSWPAMTDRVEAPSGVSVVPLTSKGVLQDEGSAGRDADGNEGLSHCVGGYHGTAMKADCHIYSIRRYNEDGSFERLSTAEFRRLNPDNNKLSCVQNQGWGNQSPGNLASDALKWFMNSVEVGQIPIQRERIDAFQEVRMSGDRHIDGLERLCGYDWKQRDLLNVAAVAWGPYVTDSWKRQKMDAILESDEVAYVAQNIIPDVKMVRF